MTTSMSGHANLCIEAPCGISPPDKSCDHRHCDIIDIAFLFVI